jgi:hypothetical protein
MNGQVQGPTGQDWNGLLHYLLHCGHFCNGLSEWSPLLTDQCLQRALINARYRYGGHPYSDLPGCRWHPGNSQDLAATSGCILELARIWQPPQQGDITNTFSHHRYWQSKITLIDKLARITSCFKLLSSGLVWMESWENRLNQAVSNPNQASQAGFSGNNTWLNSRCTTVQVALLVDGHLRNVLAQHLPDALHLLWKHLHEVCNPAKYNHLWEYK